MTKILKFFKLWIYPGDTYTSNIDLTEEADLEEIPAAPEDKSKCPFVFFDLETTGLGEAYKRFYVSLLLIVMDLDWFIRPCQIYAWAEDVKYV